MYDKYVIDPETPDIARDINRFSNVHVSELIGRKFVGVSVDEDSHEWEDEDGRDIETIHHSIIIELAERKNKP